jgi:phenylacetate-CoA ligase
MSEADRARAATPSGSLRHPIIQTLPAPELSNYQDAQLRDAIEMVYIKPVPFFRRKLMDAGVTADEIQSCKELPRIPITTKADLRASIRTAPPLGDFRASTARDWVRVITSSGATGEPMITGLTARDLAAEQIAYDRRFWRAGIRPGDIVVNSHPGYLSGGSEFLSSLLERFPALAVSLGPPDSDEDGVWRQLEFLRSTFTPTCFLIGAPAFIRYSRISEARGHMFPRDFGAGRLAFFEPVFQWPEARLWFEDALSASISMSVGLSEVLGSYAQSCPLGWGLHICADLVYVECVDAATHVPVMPGKRGLLVLTSFSRDGIILRYSTDDIGIILPDEPSCGCGDTHPRILNLGRVSDQVVVDNHTIMPVDVMRALVSFDGLTPNEVLQCQLIRQKGATALGVLLDRSTDVVSRPATGRLEEHLSDHLNVNVTVHLGDNKEKSLAYKPQRVIDQ